jgi:hypothetical protein
MAMMQYSAHEDGVMGRERNSKSLTPTPAKPLKIVLGKL